MKASAIQYTIQYLKAHEISRYILVGCMNTLFGYGMFALFTALGLHYVYAVFFATCLGILFNFKSLGVLVFENKDNSLLLRFIAVYILLYLFNILVIKVTGYYLSNLYIRGAIATGLAAILTYILNKKLVFKTKNPAPVS